MAFRAAADDTTRRPHGNCQFLDRHHFSIRSQVPANAASSVDATRLSIPGTSISLLRLLSYTYSTLHDESLPAGVPDSVISNVRLPLVQVRVVIVRPHL